MYVQMYEYNARIYMYYIRTSVRTEFSSRPIFGVDSFY